MPELSLLTLQLLSSAEDMQVEYDKVWLLLVQEGTNFA